VCSQPFVGERGLPIGQRATRHNPYPTLQSTTAAAEIACYRGCSSEALVHLLQSEKEYHGQRSTRSIQATPRSRRQPGKIKMTHIASETMIKKPSLAFEKILIFNFSRAGWPTLDATGVSIMTPALASPTAQAGPASIVLVKDPRSFMDSPPACWYY